MCIRDRESDALREPARGRDQDVVGKEPRDAPVGLAERQPGQREHCQEGQADGVALGDRAFPQ
eukprot:3344984-Alexandrium_andersonii.AAC.1